MIVASCIFLLFRYMKKIILTKIPFFVKCLTQFSVTEYICRNYRFILEFFKEPILIQNLCASHMHTLALKMHCWAL